jgi:hypothetical protein
VYIFCSSYLVILFFGSPYFFRSAGYVYVRVYVCSSRCVGCAAALPADNFVSFGRLPRRLRGWERTRPVIATTRTIAAHPCV